MKIKQLLENWIIILEEGTNYAEMYNFIEKYINQAIEEYRNLVGYGSEQELNLTQAFKAKSEITINQIKQISDRQDVRIWAARISKYTVSMRIVEYITYDIETFVDNFGRDASSPSIAKLTAIRNQLLDEGNRFAAQYISPVHEIQNWSNFNDFAYVMTHYLSLPIPEIQDFRFEKEHTYEHVFMLFSDYESQWEQRKEEDKQIVMEKGHIIIDFGDGYAWWDLEDTGCEAEGAAMGHCGNVPARGDYNQTIFSLREKTDREGYLKPHLTFVYFKNEEGFGERKGRGNSRPIAKFHKYIKALIMEPFVKRFLEGRSYKPENDFQITDLSDWKQIFEQKPDLLPLRQYIKEIGFDDYIKSKFEFESRYSAETVIDDGNELHLIYKKSRIEETMYEDTGAIGYRLANMLVYGNKEDIKGPYELGWMQACIDEFGKKLFPNLNPFKWHEFINADDFFKPQSSAVRIADQIRNLCANAFQDMLIEAVKDPSKITGKANLFVKETSGRGFSMEPASHGFNTITWEGYATNNGIGITINKDALFGHIDPYVLSDDFILVLSAKEFELIPRGSLGNRYVTIGDSPYNDPGFLKLDVSYEFDEFLVETDTADIIFNQQMTAPFFRPYIDGIKREFLELFSEYEYIAPEPFLR